MGSPIRLVIYNEQPYNNVAPPDKTLVMSQLDVVRIFCV
jgi:hypothetical protein